MPRRLHVWILAIMGLRLSWSVTKKAPARYEIDIGIEVGC